MLLFDRAVVTNDMDRFYNRLAGLRLRGLRGRQRRSCFGGGVGRCAHIALRQRHLGACNEQQTYP